MNIFHDIAVFRYKKYSHFRLDPGSHSLPVSIFLYATTRVETDNRQSSISASLKDDVLRCGVGENYHRSWLTITAAFVIVFVVDTVSSETVYFCE